MVNPPRAIVLAIVKGSGTLFVDSRPEDFRRFRARVSFFAPFLSAPSWMLMVAVGSPDGIIARNSTGSVALALVAGVANGPPLEARRREGKCCYRPVSASGLCTPHLIAPQAEARFHPKNEISLVEILNTRNQQAQPKRVRGGGPHQRGISGDLV